jgi:PAS domain S-box-containing protein
MADAQPRTKLDVNKLSRVSSTSTYVLPALLIILGGAGLALFQPDMPSLLVWIASLFLYTLSDVLTGRLNEGVWGGYTNLAVMVAWLVLGPIPALALILVGAGLTVLVRLYLGVSQSAIAFDAIGRIAISASGLLAGSFIYRLSSGQLPLQVVDRTNILALAAAILGGFITAHATGSWISTHLLSLEIKPIWLPEQRFHLLAELVTLPAIAVLPLIAHHAGDIVFTVIMILVGVNGAYLRQVSRTARQSAALYEQSKDLVRNLSVINQSVQSVLFNLNSEEALTAACNAAMTITQAQKAAILVLDADRKYLQLAEQVGLTEAHRQRVKKLPFDLESSDLPRVVADTETLPSDEGLVKLARAGSFRAFLEMPLRSGHVVLGYLTVYHDQPRTYRESEIDLLETLANQVTAALDNAQLLRALELYAFEMTQLVHLSRISASSLDLEKLVANIPDNLRHMMSASHVSIALLQNESIYLLETTSETPIGDRNQIQFPEFQSVLNDKSTRRHTIQASDKVSDRLARYMAAQELASLILVPILANGNLLGVVLLGNDEPHVFTDREWQLIETATNQIAGQISNARTYSTTQAALNRRLEQLSVIEDIVRQISASVDLNQIISLVLDAAINSTQADIGVLAMLTDAEEFWIIGHQYLDGQLQKHYIRRPIEQGVIGEVARSGQAVLVADNSATPYYVTSFPGTYQSSLGVPLLKDEVVSGVLLVESTQKDFFTEDQASFLKNLAGHTVISIDNARLLETLHYQLVTLISLRELSLHLSSAVNTSEVAAAVLATATVIFRAHDAAVFRHDSKDDSLTLLSHVWGDEAQHMGAETQLLQQAAQQAVRRSELLQVDNLEADPAYHIADNVSYRALTAVPISRGRQVHEVLCLGFVEPQTFEESELNAMHLLASQAAGHLENARLHEQIRDNNDRMQAILDSTRDGVILLDRDGRLIEANPSAQQLLSINLSEHIGEHFATLLLMEIDAGESELSVYSREEATSLARLLRLEPERISSRQFERRMPNRVIYIEEIGSPVLDEHNQIAGRLLTLRDITEQKLLEAYRDDITQMAVHDLRAPMASMINALGLTLESLEETNGDPSSAFTLGLALTSARSLMNLVDTMLDIAKLERRALPLRRAPTSIAQMIETVSATLASSIQKANVRLNLQVAPSLPMANVDSDKVHRVLVNLVDNASRYTPAGGEILVSAQLLPKRKRLLITVADSGPGIPPEEQQRIFEKFTQIQSRDPLRGHKGHGLGLTFCKLVIEAHGERLWVEQDSPLPGACFAFTLPVA